MTDDLVTSAFEACATFVGDDAVCEHCGWLVVEHEQQEVVPRAA